MFCTIPPFSCSSGKTKSASLNQFLTWLDGVSFLPYVLQHTWRLSRQAAISQKHQRPLRRRGLLWYGITQAETLITSVYRSNLLCKDLLKHNPYVGTIYKKHWLVYSENFWTPGDSLWKGQECLTKVAKIGPFPWTILYKSCLFTSNQRPLFWKITSLGDTKQCVHEHRH